MIKVYRFKIDALDALDGLLMRLLDGIAAARNKARKKWIDAGGLDELD